MHDRALSTQRSAVHFLGTVVEKGDMETVFLFIDRMRELNIYSMMLRIALAMFVGGILGFEREKKGRPAGFRTYMLVAMGAALTVILSQYLVLMQKTAWAEYFPAGSQSTDISRFAAQVINGVGFLGAGTIIVTGRQQVKGLTTAAGLWASACMGIAVGAGFYECVIVAMLLVIFCMKLLPVLEEFMISRSRNMCIFIEMDTFENLAHIVNRIKSENVKLYDVEIEREKHEHLSDFSVLFTVRLPRKMRHAELLATLSTLDGIAAIDVV